MTIPASEREAVNAALAAVDPWFGPESFAAQLYGGDDKEQKTPTYYWCMSPLVIDGRSVEPKARAIVEAHGGTIVAGTLEKIGKEDDPAKIEFTRLGVKGKGDLTTIKK
jgi:hypothetical protein